jgi:hypothetical protein
MIAFAEVEVLLHSFLTSALDDDDSPDSRSAALTPGNPSTKWFVSCHCRESNVTIPTELPRLLTAKVGRWAKLHHVYCLSSVHTNSVLGSPRDIVWVKLTFCNKARTYLRAYHDGLCLCLCVCCTTTRLRSCPKTALIQTSRFADAIVTAACSLLTVTLSQPSPTRYTEDPPSLLGAFLNSSRE